MTRLPKSTLRFGHKLFNAICDSIESGTVNFLDTAINFRYQKSEKTIAAALIYLIKKSKISREELFLSTKGGFVHEDADLGITADVVLDKLVNSGQIEASDVYDSNCIHPKFLELQLNTSLTNLGVDAIDCYSLNLPEIHLYRQDNASFYKSLLVD